VQHATCNRLQRAACDRIQRAGDFEHLMNTNMQVAAAIQSLVRNVKHEQDTSLMPDPFGSPVRGPANPVAAHQASAYASQVRAEAPLRARARVVCNRSAVWCVQWMRWRRCVRLGLCTCSRGRSAALRRCLRQAATPRCATRCGATCPSCKRRSRRSTPSRHARRKRCQRSTHSTPVLARGSGDYGSLHQAIPAASGLATHTHTRARAHTHSHTCQDGMVTVDGFRRILGLELGLSTPDIQARR
jgi:hypothetical protein